ncbi:hypothetical protein [Candidatus Poriferisodalis sp.]|uniref:hypothetical protein n=1 Tax=Candidatus Poriferisodalis sp. TaxID=3101277 RepID=UPI003D12F7CC
MIKRIRFWVPVVVLALLSSTVAAAPAAATGDGGSGFFEDDTPGNTATDENDDSGGDEEPLPDEDVLAELAPEGPAGPVGYTGAPTYEAQWVPGGIVPWEVKVLRDDENVDLVTIAPEDGSALMALLIIDNEDAATEYRFENAVPAGHTAELQPDGSVRFFDAEGNEAGMILAPWALDGVDESVATSYRLDGSTLVQTIDHEGAAYPVVADPFWVAVVVAIRICAAYPQCVNTAVTFARLSPAVVAPVVSHAWNARTRLVTGDGSSGTTGRPTNTCNSRNRQGC